MENQKMAFKEKFNTWKNNVKDFCENHKTEIVVGVASIATFVGGALLVKKLGDMADVEVGDVTKLDIVKELPNEVPTAKDWIKEGIDKWKELDMDETDDFVREKLKEIHDACVEKDVVCNIMCGIGGGAEDSDFDHQWIDLEYYNDGNELLDPDIFENKV